MRVQCDVCGGEPAAVLCCADEAALCAACDRRVHRANKLAGQHRRLQLLHPAADSAGPLCDVCKERTGLVFCVEDRAILCADCDDPIHSANDLTAKHTRFLLVGAKLSAAALADQDQELPSPDCGGPDKPNDAAAACVSHDASTDRSSVLDCSSNNNGGGANSSSISDYLTNICPGWRVDDLLFDDTAAFCVEKGGRDEHEQVPSLDADLFDVVAGRPGKRGAWASALLDEVPAAMAAPAGKQQRERPRYRNSDSDVFAVPEISPPPAKRARPSPSYWCF